MKIATWNIDRPKVSSRKNREILEILRGIDADILVLTETNFVIDPGKKHTPLSSDPLPVPGPYQYTHGENETTIWSKYPLRRVETRHPSISTCAKVQTPNGELNVYGTVIGILGPIGKNKGDFLLNLKEQIEDWKRIRDEEGDICIVGDFNVCWLGKGFPNTGRDEIAECFSTLEVQNLTRDVEGSIDHIAISTSFMKSAKFTVHPPWNLEKTLRRPKLSDHIGVSVSFDF